MITHVFILDLDDVNVNNRQLFKWNKKYNSENDVMSINRKGNVTIMTLAPE